MGLSLLRRVSLGLLLGISLAGCGALPSAGPTSVEISSGAENNGEFRYLLRDIDEPTVNLLLAMRPVSLQGSFGARRPAPTQRIAVGDTLVITIWEAASGGLFSAPVLDRTSTGARSAMIPEQVVARDSSITVPYAGRISVAGLTPPEVERKIVSLLAGKAIEPQVLVTISKSIGNSATVIGEVTAGARVPLSVRGDRILDVLAAAGGVKAPVHEAFVTLQRGGRSETVPFSTLINRPVENIYVMPSDVITVVRTPQTYSIFGATGRNMVIPFDAAGLTLEQALAKAGGLVDMRSDPYGVFLLRFEDIALARKLDPSYKFDGKGVQVPVIYRLNLRDANGYFLAQRVQIRNRDVIYVANAPLTEMQKALSLFATIVQPVSMGASTVSSGMALGVF
ncbi:MAG TPA: polysaccharide biosynthesis/export family protein [Rhabdaerophilum sp.]|nr:polysaccharide biosynthesis/export family protein [Rhabdaerophilum sp.]